MRGEPQAPVAAGRCQMSRASRPPPAPPPPSPSLSSSVRRGEADRSRGDASPPWPPPSGDAGGEGAVTAGDAAPDGLRPRTVSLTGLPCGVCPT